MQRLQPDISKISLEAENRLLRTRLDEFMAEASYNEQTHMRCHERELALLAAEDLPQLLHILTQGMQASFRLPCISLVLLDPEHELRHLLANTGTPAETLNNICFVDRLSTFSPLFEGLRRPWLGPFLGYDHQALFPRCQALRSVALLPMIRRNTLVGWLNLGSDDPSRFTRHHASDFLNRLATIGAVCLENTANREQLVVSGLTDALTGLHNRRYLERRLSEEIARSRRYGHPLSCLFIDADHFKLVNDLHGHSAGDQVLREISLRVRECLRGSDVATRFGGEEFALLLPQTGLAEALKLADRIRQRVQQNAIPTGKGSELAVTISIGVSELKEADQEDAGERLISSADAALYQAKREGRNRVRCAPVEIP